MPGVLLRDHIPCEFDGESYYISEIDAARVNIPDAGEGVSIRIIPDNSLNNLKYGDTTLLLTFNDARLLAQAILSVAFETTYWQTPPPPAIITGSGNADPEPPDLLGAEPETGRLPADPRGPTPTWKDGIAPTFEPMDIDALERVDAGGDQGIIKAMDGGLV